MLIFEEYHVVHAANALNMFANLIWNHIVVIRQQNSILDMTKETSLSAGTYIL